MLMHYDVRRDQMVYLAPELCRFVGVNEQLIEERKPYIEVKIARRTDAPIKIKQATKLINHLMENRTCQENMEQWRFYFDQSVVPVEGLKYDAGNIVMGLPANDQNRISLKGGKEPAERIKFCIEDQGKELTLPLTKNKMFDQPVIQKWGIFYQAKDYAQAKNLVMHMEKVL